MRQLIVRFLNVAVIAAVLIGYNTVLDKRDKEDQIARLSAELGKPVSGLRIDHR